MSFIKVIVENSGDIALIKLNDAGTLNAISPEMIDELAYAFSDCERRSRAIVLTSVGRAFSSGLRFAKEKQVSGQRGDDDAGLLLETHVNPLIVSLNGLTVPWIAAIRGPVVGVACSIAFAADMVVASDTTYFSLAFSRLGLVPDGGSTWHLMRTLGRARAMEMMLLGDRLPAQTALQWGLVNSVVSDPDLDNAALALADRLAQGPTAAYALIRQLSWTAANRDFASALAAERIAQRNAGLSGDAKEGRDALINKRPPKFSGG